MFFNGLGAIANQVKKYLNSILNGDFTATTGWRSTTGTMSVANNVMTFTGNGASLSARIAQTSSIDCVTDKKIFVYGIMTAKNAACSRLWVYITGSVTAGTTRSVRVDTPVENQQYVLASVLTVPSNMVGKIDVSIASNYADAATANGKITEIQKAIVYDLSANGLADKDVAWCIANIVPNITW